MYKEADGKLRGERVIPNSEESIIFSNNIWSVRKEPTCLMAANCREEFEKWKPLEEVEITEEMVKKQCWEVPHWGASGRDSIKRYWLKNLTSLQSMYNKAG